MIDPPKSPEGSIGVETFAISPASSELSIDDFSPTSLSTSTPSIFTMEPFSGSGSMRPASAASAANAASVVAGPSNEVEAAKYQKCNLL